MVNDNQDMKDEAASAEGQEKPEAKSKEQEYKEMLQRLQADFENYKKRVEREKADAKEMAKIDVIRAFLPVLDSFEQAHKTLSQKPSDDSSQLKKDLADARKGFELVYAQALSAFKSQGVTSIQSLKRQFSPYEHEVLMQGESDSPEGTIIEEFQKGYAKDKTVIRHAKVKTSSGKNKDSKKGEGQ